MIASSMIRADRSDTRMRSHRMKLRLAAIACAPIAMFLSHAAAAGATSPSKPVWAIKSTAVPSVWQANKTGGSSVLAPPMINVLVENVGSAATKGPFTLTDELPEGVSVRPEVKLQTSWTSGTGGGSHLGESVPPVSCTVAGRVITCGGPSTFNSVPVDVRPGEGFFVNIPASTGELTASTIVDEAAISGGGAETSSDEEQIPVGANLSQFDFLSGRDGVETTLSAGDGSSGTVAGSHPYVARFSFGFPLLTREQEGHESVRGVAEGAKEIVTTLPRGLVINPEAVPTKCTENQLETEVAVESTTMPTCPPASQVGTVFIGGAPEGLTGSTVPLFEMVPPGGAAAALGFQAGVSGVFYHLIGRVNSAGAYEVAAQASNLSNRIVLSRAKVTLWGEPQAPSHDFVRGECAFVTRGPCRTGGTGRPYVTLPSQCGESGMAGEVEATAWEPGPAVRRAFTLTDLRGNPLAVTDCGSLSFEPSISAQPTIHSTDSPTGLSVDLHQSQDEGGEERTPASLRDAQVTLPRGISLNPSASNGLDACTEAQIGRTSLDPLRFSEASQTCPNASKIGTVEVRTPLLDHSLSGAVYTAKPFANPFHSLLAIYLAVEDERSGVISKLAGRVDANETTGQLTATFTENPELPLEDVSVDFFSGDRAALKTGVTCGTFETSANLTPWSSPQAPSVNVGDRFSIGRTPDGSPCPASEAGAPAQSKLVAGTLSSQAGAYSPLVFSVSREDGSQQLSSIEATLPPGLLGRLAGIPYCPQAAIDKAQSRSVANDGAVEIADPSCPAASEVGSVEVKAGAGSTPIAVQGHAYLAGPYKGAPVSLEIVTPAVAGPFDLGVVAVRTALAVDPLGAQITAKSDPLPRILHGIPLDVRSVTLKMSRPQFTLNPTSCNPTSIQGTLGTFAGAFEPVSEHFQVGDCNSLKFKPKLQISLKGPTKRTGLPALKAVLTYPKQGAYANIARAQVNLPKSEFIEQNNLDKACTKPVLLEGKCAKRSIYGKAKAWTPLLDKPLEGPVYLVGGFGYKLPAMVAELNGQIRVLLKGKVDSGPNGGIRNTFEAVPDAPVSRFVLELKGGRKYGLLINSENLCKKPQHAIARFTAQNGLVDQTKPVVSNSCKSKGGRARHAS